MRRFRYRRTFFTIFAAFICLVFAAFPIWAQTEVEVACCDGSMHPTGFDCTAYCCSIGYQSACPSSPNGGGNSSGGYVPRGGNPIQNAELQGASEIGNALGQALGNAIVNMFIGGESSDQDQEAAREAARQKALEQMRQALKAYESKDAACRGTIQAMNAREKAAESQSKSKAAIRDDLLAELGGADGTGTAEAKLAKYADSNGNACPNPAGHRPKICAKDFPCLCGEHAVRVGLRGGRTACLSVPGDWDQLALDIEGSSQEPLCGSNAQPAQTLSGGWACKPLACSKAGRKKSRARSVLDDRLSRLAAMGASSPAGSLAQQIQQAKSSFEDCQSQLSELRNEEAAANASEAKRKKKSDEEELLSEMGGTDGGNGSSASSGGSDDLAFSWQEPKTPVPAPSPSSPSGGSAPVIPYEGGSHAPIRWSRAQIRFILPTGTIYQAAQSGNTSQINNLIGQGLDPNQSSGQGVTPLMTASYSGQGAAVKALVSHGAKINLADSDGRTPLMYAASRNRFGAARELISLGANINLQDADGMTALDYAVVNGAAQLARALLAAGADAGIKNKQGQTALSLAEAGPSRPEIIEIIKTVGAQEKTPQRPFHSDVDVPSFKYPARPDDWALVVGIESYQRLPKAEFAKRDAQAAEKYFVALGVPRRNVISLIDSTATRGAIQSYLEEYLPKNVSPKSRVYFYYSGHGAPDARSREAYLVPWDASPEFIRDQGFLVARLYKDLSKLKAARTLAAMDACFSGAGGRSVMAPGTRPLVIVRIDGVHLGPRMAALAAAKGSEIAGSLKSQGHGIFTYYFLKGLNLKPRRVRPLYEFLRPKVEKSAARQNIVQDPVIEGADIEL